MAGWPVDKQFFAKPIFSAACLPCLVPKWRQLANIAEIGLGEVNSRSENFFAWQAFLPKLSTLAAPGAGAKQQASWLQLGSSLSSCSMSQIGLGFHEIMADLCNLLGPIQMVLLASDISRLCILWTITILKLLNM